MIDKWLNAGVLEEGRLHFATDGTPQGGVISPILSNIFLHHVLDRWFVEEVRPRLIGEATLVRFADDFVMISRPATTRNGCWKCWGNGLDGLG